MEETVIKPAFSMKFLGVITDRGLLWIEHSRYVAGKISRAAHRIRAVAGTTWGTNPRMKRLNPHV